MRDVFTHIGDAVDSVVNRRTRSNEVANAMRELNEFLDSQRVVLPDRPSLPGAPELERQQVNVRDDNQLGQLANDKLAGERVLAESAINTRIDNQESGLNTARENAQRSAVEQKESLAANTERAAQHINNDSLRRGLARSSIAVNRQADLAENSANQAQAIAGNMHRQLEQIDNDIASLEGQRAQAIADFNVTHAARLSQTIHQLRVEQDRAVRDAKAFNNNVAEQERRAEIERQDRESALYLRELDIAQRENAMTGQSSDTAVFNRMVEILLTLSPADARRQVMENPIFKENLSPQQFYRLFAQFARR